MSNVTLSLELALILGFLAHLLGDYVFQNHWMAMKKTSSLPVACLHAFIYSIPFLLLTASEGVYTFFIIWTTHTIIDRYRLAVYWVKLINWNWESTNNGFSEKVPKYLSTWLLIIVDNIFHLVINSVVIYYSYIS